MDRENFGIDADATRRLRENEELESQLPFEQPEDFDDLSCFLIRPDSSFAQVETILVQVITWWTLFATSLAITFFDDVDIREAIHTMELLVDIAWATKICLLFITADKEHQTFKSIAGNYLKFWFWIDAIATFPSLVFYKE